MKKQLLLLATIAFAGMPQLSRASSIPACYTPNTEGTWRYDYFRYNSERAGWTPVNASYIVPGFFVPIPYIPSRGWNRSESGYPLLLADGGGAFAYACITASGNELIYLLWNRRVFSFEDAVDELLR